MKKLHWFKTGEEIPDNSKYLKSENKIVEFYHYMTSSVPKYEEFHLYEITFSEGEALKLCTHTFLDPNESRTPKYENTSSWFDNL